MSDAKDAFLNEVGNIDFSNRHYEEEKSYRETGFNKVEVTSKPFPLSQSATVLTELIQDVSTAAGNIGMAANFSPIPQPGFACDITDHSYSTTGIKTNGIHFHQSIDRINGQAYENFFQGDHEHIQDPSEKKRQTRLDAISRNIFQDSYVLFLSEAGDLTAYNEHSLERRDHNKVVPKEWKHSSNKSWGAAIREVEDDKQGPRIESRFYDTLMNPSIISPIISAATLYALEQTLVYTEFPIPVNQEFVDALKMNDGALNLQTLKENYSSVLQDCLDKIDGLSDSQAMDYPDRQQIAALPLFLEYIRPSHENNDKNLLREKIEKYKVEIEQRYDQLITAQQAHPDLHDKESLSRQEFAVLLQETGS
jgi:hypothetical protein